MRCFLWPRRSSSHLNKKSLASLSKGDGDSSRYHPIYLRNTKRVVPRDGFSVVPPSFIFIRSTLGSLTQATPARPTSISVMQFRKELPYFLFTGSQHSRLSVKIRNTYFFHQHFCNMCLLYRMMRKCQAESHHKSGETLWSHPKEAFREGDPIC